MGAKVTLAANLDTQDPLINIQKNIFCYIARISVLEVQFSNEQALLKAMRSLYLGRQNYWVPIERCEDEILIKEGLTSPSIKRTQFPSTLPLASTVHKALLTSI